MWYVPARPAAVRQRQRIVRSATRRPCRGSVGVRRRPRSVHALLRQCAARRGAGQEEGGVRRPHLRHRRVVRGELVATLCDLARRSPAPIRADSVRGPSGVDAGGAALPVVVRDGPVGAAGEQRHGGFGAAVDRRPVQRCGPAGRRRRSRSAADRPPPDGPPAKAHPPMFLVFTSARATTSFPTIA